MDKRNIDDIFHEYLRARLSDEKYSGKLDTSLKIAGLFIAILGLIWGANYYITTRIDSNIESTNINVNKNKFAMHLPGAGYTYIQTGFIGGASQACVYYSANYETLYPYTVLWDVSEKKGSYPKIRVIADKGTWKAEKCLKTKPETNKYKGEVKLIGLETIKHRLEAQFKENGEFIHIADTEFKYHSALLFNNKGTIIHRKILVSPKKEEENGYINKLVSETLIKEKDKYNAAYKFYIKKRIELHEDLKEKGCGAISMQPDFINKETNEIEKPTVIYICHRDGQKSHIRVMQRVN